MKRPGEAFGRAYDDPAHGFLHPVDLDAAQPPARRLLHDPRRPRRHGARARAPRRRAPTSSTPSTRRSSPTRRDHPALRQADPPGRGGGRRGVGDRRTTSPCSAGSSDRGDRRRRRHVLAATRHASASAARCARTRRRPPAGRARGRRRARLRRPLRQRAGRVPAPALGDLADRRRPRRGVPAPAPRRPVRAAAASTRSRWSPVPEEELATQGCNILAVRPGRGGDGRGQPGHAARAARPRLRGAHLPGRRGVHQRLAAARPASPARSCADEEPDARPSWPSVANVDRDRLADDLAALVRDPQPDRRRGRRADRGRAADDRRPGSTSSGSTPTRVDLSADPDFPGVEVARTVAPGRDRAADRRRGRAAGADRRARRRRRAAATSWPGRRRRFGARDRGRRCSTGAARAT